MKKIVLLFAGAIASFLLLSYIDEYENLIMPFFRAERPAQYVGGADEIKSTIDAFTDSLERAYLLSDPSPLRLAHIDERLYSSISQEIDYLKREGRVMVLDVKDTSIEKIEVVSRDVIRVTTREKVSVKYLNAVNKKEINYTDSVYIMSYTLAAAGGGLRIISYESVGAKPL